MRATRPGELPPARGEVGRDPARRPGDVLYFRAPDMAVHGGGRRLLRCLWLCRVLPFPLTSGDRIYSARLAGALAAAGADVTFAGLMMDTPPTALPGVEWHAVPDVPRSNFAGLFSLMPLVAARHATPVYRGAVTALARDGVWDVVIIDNYAMGWVLAHRHEFSSCPVFVFLTHNHEVSVSDLQWRDPGASLAVRAYLVQNHLKTRRFERQLARACDVVTTITHTDAALFAAKTHVPNAIVLSPGHEGPRLESRRIDDRLPRTLLMFGSYRWSAKQASLRSFLDRADAVLATAGIKICIVGDMENDLRRSLEGRYRATEIVGYVDDPTPYLATARLAVVAEPIGGGFKLKLLEYVFNRIPVAALEACAAGLPDALRRHMLLKRDIDALVAALVDAIDDTAGLDAMQRNAFAAAEHGFDWRERGAALHAAIIEAQHRVVEAR